MIFLVTAGIVVPLFSRIRLGTLLGFALAGVALGPSGLAKLACAKDPAHAHRLIGLGATDVVSKATEGSLQLATHVLKGIGLPDHKVFETIDGVRTALLDDLGPEQS